MVLDRCRFELAECVRVFVIECCAKKFPSKRVVSIYRESMDVM